MLGTHLINNSILFIYRRNNRLHKFHNTTFHQWAVAVIKFLSQSRANNIWTVILIANLYKFQYKAINILISNAYGCWDSYFRNVPHKMKITWYNLMNTFNLTSSWTTFLIAPGFYIVNTSTCSFLMQNFNTKCKVFNRKISEFW